MMKRIACVLLTLIMLVSLVPATVFTASAASLLTTSENAIKVLKEMEGFVATAYLDGYYADGTPHYSIGYGTSSTEGATITEAEADQALRTYLKSVDTAINSFAARVERNFSQNQHDALALFSYNCGTAWMSASTGRFRQSVVNGDTGNDFLYNICLWANVGDTPSTGLLNRRLAEANMYLNGVYSRYAPSNYTYVIFNANGGSVGEDKMQGYNMNTPVAVGPIPERGGYRFMGWYTAAEGGECVTVLNNTTAGMTLYAHWQAEDGGVDEEGKIVGTPASYTVSAAQAASLKVYETPSTSAEVVKQLLSSDSVKVVAEYIDANNVKWVNLEIGGWLSLGDVEKPIVQLTSVTVTVTNDYVNVRDNAGTYGTNIIGKVLLGDQLTITATTTVNGSLWGRFDDGWVALMYTNYSDVIEQGSTSSTDKVIATAIVQCNTKVNIRNAPGTTGTTVVGSLANGTKVDIYEIGTVDSHEWGRIAQGWFCLDYAVVTMVDSSTGGDEDTDSPETEDTDTPENEDATPVGPIATGTVHHTYVNIRSGAGAGYAYVGKLNMGDVISIYEITTVNGHKWGRFDKGWVCLDYVTVTYINGAGSGSGSNSDDQDTLPEGVICTGTVTHTYVNYRSGAGTGHARLGQLNYGDVINIYEITTVNGHKWGRFDKGWVCLDYVTLNTQSGTGDSTDTEEGGSTTTGNLAASSCLTDLTAFVEVDELAVYNEQGQKTGRIFTKGQSFKVTALGFLKGTDGQTLEGLDFVMAKCSFGYVDASKLYLQCSQTYYMRRDWAVSSSYNGPATDVMVKESAAVTVSRVVCDGQDIWAQIKSGDITGWVPAEELAASAYANKYIVSAKADLYTVNGDVAKTLGAGEKITVTSWVTISGVKYGVVLEHGDLLIRADKLISYEDYVDGSESVEGYYATLITDAIVYDGYGEQIGTLSSGTMVIVYALGYYEDENGNPVGEMMAEIDQGLVEADTLQISTPNEYYIVSGVTSGLNVRNAPASEEIKATLPNGTPVISTKIQIVGETVWAYITTDVVSGWVNAEYLIDDPAYSGSTPGTEPDTDPDTGSTVRTGVVSGADVVNVRVAAGVQNDLATTLKRGTQVTVYEQITKDNAPWGRIDQGWICMYYVTLDPETSGGTTGDNTGSTITPDIGTGDSTYATGYVNSNVDLNVRTGPGTDYAKVGALKNGTEVVVYEQQLRNGMIWGRIGTDQWVCMSYVTLTSSGSSGSGVMGTIGGCYYAVNVRSAPGTGNALVGKIMVGSRVEIYEQVQYGGSWWGRVAQGWICMDYVLLDSDLPANDPNLGGSTGTDGSTGNDDVVVDTTGFAATVVNVNEEVIVRKEADLNSTQVTTAKLGATVYISELKYVNNVLWAKAAGGWIRMDYLKVTTADYTVDGVQKNLIIRNAPGGEQLGNMELLNGDKATVIDLDVANDIIWAKIQVDAQVTGWVNSNYLKAGYTAPDSGTSGGTTGGTTDGTTGGTTGGVTEGMGSTNTGANNAYGYLYTGTVIGTNQVNVRATASTSAAVTTQLKRGQALVIYELAVSEYMAWGRCDAGWVCLVYVDLVPYNSDAIDARVVQKDGALVYESAGSNPIGSYAKCAVVDIYEMNGTWARTEHGWVSIYDLLA